MGARVTQTQRLTLFTASHGQTILCTLAFVQQAVATDTEVVFFFCVRAFTYEVRVDTPGSSQPDTVNKSHPDIVNKSQPNDQLVDVT